MTGIHEILINKIENNIKKIGSELRNFAGCSGGNYVENREKAIKIGHIFSWTQSFHTGIALWAYKQTGKKEYLEWAEQFYEEYREKVFDIPLETMHDLGFLYSPYAVMLYNITGDEKYKNLAIRAAEVLAMRFDPKGRYIKAWGRMDNKIPEYVDENLANDHFFTESEGLAIIDSMMNIPLLFWASKTSGHPYYKRIAIAHADTTLKCFVRGDYSVNHAFRFSEETGMPVGEANYCGYSCGSYWARGAAWAIYGFAIAYRYTKKPEYLDISFALLDKFMKECNGKIPVWDFRLPDDEEKAADTSASAVVLCALIEIEKIKSNTKLSKYKKIIRDNLKQYINNDPNVMGILSEQNGGHIYSPIGDYFIIESMMQENQNLTVW